jgi:DNA polymerase epsilon subunit 1
MQVHPSVYVTYNGDFFDWPFIEARAQHHGLDMHAALGFKIQRGGECLSRAAVHMDCLCWVNRDSYLPQGSRGLKVCTTSLLSVDSLLNLLRLLRLQDLADTLTPVATQLTCRWQVPR